MVRDYEIRSSCHMIEEASCLHISSYPLHLAASILVPFFMMFYSVKVVRSMATFGRSVATKVFVMWEQARLE